MLTMSCSNPLTETGRPQMRARFAFAVAFVAATAAAAPAMAANAMAPANSMMSGHDSMMVMPSCETMIVPAMKGQVDPAVAKAAMPMNKCVIMMMGTDHKMHMVEDMKMADGKMACAE